MMLLFGYLVICIGLVVGAPETSTINGYVVTIDNHILKSVEKTSNPSDHLDLSNQQLVGIDQKAFTGLDNLKTLILDNNHLPTLPEMVFWYLPNLQDLSLANNALDKFNNIFFGLNNLKSLKISGNPLSMVFPENFVGLKESVIRATLRANNADRGLDLNFSTRDLAILCISNGGIVRSLESVDNAKIAQDAQNCNQVNLVKVDATEIYLQKFGITGFVKGWYRILNTTLKILNLSNNKISELTSMMLNDLPKSMTDVYLNGNPIEDLKKGIIKNKNLRRLDFDNCIISEIEDNALTDTSLTNVSFNYNRLKNLNFVKTLPINLTILSLNNNEIVELVPDTFYGLDKLKSLKLGGNKIRSLKKGVFNGLENLKGLSIADNQLREINGDSFEGLSDKLVLLELHGNQIEKLKKGTFINKPREYLSLSHNKITEIESGTFDLPTLDVLEIHCNFLTSWEGNSFGLPERFYNLEPFEYNEEKCA